MDDTNDYIKEMVNIVHDNAVIEGKYLALSEMFNALHTGRIKVCRTDVQYGIAQFLSEYIDVMEGKA